METLIQFGQQFGLPALLCVLLFWRQRESDRECQAAQRHLWTELVRIASLLPPHTRKED